MKLLSGEGAGIELRPVAYQFDRAPGDDEWDRNWLVIRGDVTAGGEGGWTFRDPCLTTWEARSLGAWLRAGGAGDPLEFVEPCLAFEIIMRSGDQVHLAVRLSAEAAPRGDREFVVPLDAAGMTQAADEWETACDAFPER
ncbi:hypothetical protein AB0J83_40575 [Actinoplanes sp. NPDC049596]|uniref:WapI family immunity protein n=1 Tax=unclassified Actinoplanes TaxID=2626549 RepID=UPI003437D088